MAGGRRTGFRARGPDDADGRFEPTRPVPTLPAARFKVFFHHGEPRSVLEWEDDGDADRVTLPNGGRLRYPKRMVDRIEPVPTFTP